MNNLCSQLKYKCILVVSHRNKHFLNFTSECFRRFLRDRQHQSVCRLGLLQDEYWRRWFKSVELTELSRTASFMLVVDKSILFFSTRFDF